MSQQTMRGMRLGTTSLESEVGVSFSERSKHVFQCGNEHKTEVVFAADAELPDTWQCRICSHPAARLADGKGMVVEIEPVAAPRSHWEMLLERRTRDELEELLQERIDYIRSRRASGKAEI